jgi:hypothetical protein
MKKKGIIVTTALTTAVLVTTLLLHLGWRSNDSGTVEEGTPGPAKQAAAFLNIWGLEEVEQKDIVYVGKTEDMGFEGKAKYTCGNYVFFFDNETMRLSSVIRNLETSEIEAYENGEDMGISEEEFIQRSDETMKLLIGEEVSSACQKSVRRNQNTVVDYDYIKEGVRIPKARFIMGYGKTFENMVLFNVEPDEMDVDSFMPEEESFICAKEAALAFMEQKYDDAKEALDLVEEAVVGEKTVDLKGDICWHWNLTFQWKDGRDMEPFFDIYLDVYTGDVITNANNYT